ncbi:MAG TPA: hypothetical protein VFX16_20570 [Pseudonocardiaceae bacterium]|nr:hypothetical protein [Pseudonocardiaceae bacterium]
MNRSVLPACLLVGVLASVLVGPPAFFANAQEGARIDLNLYYDEPVIAAGGIGIQTLTVTNSGADGTTPIDLTVTTGVFVAVDPAGRMPKGCGFLYQDGDPDATVPEVVRCVLPPLEHNDSTAVTLPLMVAEAAAAGDTFGTATVLPEPGSPDVDQHVADNLGWPSVVVTNPGTSVGAPTNGQVTDLYVTTDLPAVATGQPAVETLTVGNRGPQPANEPIRLVVVTPPLVRLATDQPMPAGCGFVYDSPDPAAPELVRCSIAPLAVGTSTTVRLPLAPVFGSPVQTSWGVAGVFPDRSAGSTDIDPVPANNLVESGVQVIG